MPFPIRRAANLRGTFSAEFTRETQRQTWNNKTNKLLTRTLRVVVVVVVVFGGAFLLAASFFSAVVQAYLA